MRILLLTIIATALPPLAAAQDLAIPGGLNLSGVWELTEYGSVRSAEKSIVRITHTGPSVFAEFILGAECFDGQARPDAFLAEVTVVHPTTPPTGLMSSPAMWVCSNDPELVQKCGGSGAVQSRYKTTFTNAGVEPNFIEGTRVTQGVKGCSLDASENGTADFALRRLEPCELEARVLLQREDDLREVLMSILGSRAIFEVAYEAAQQRYGETFQGAPTTWLSFPHQTISGDWEGDSELTEEFFDIHPAVLASDQWKRARDMAAEMALLALNDQPLLEVRDLLEHMYRIEAKAPEGQQALAAMRLARAALEKCRRAQP